MKKGIYIRLPKKCISLRKGLERSSKYWKMIWKRHFLFERQKGVIPTDSGKCFYEKSKQFVQEFQEMKREIAMMNREKNELRIGFSTGTLKAISIQRIFEYMAAHTDSVITWGENENEKVIATLKEGTLDFGFITSKEEDERLRQMEIASIPIVLFVYEGHPFWNDTQVDMEMIKEEDIIVMNEQYHIYYDFMRSCQMHGFLPKIRAKTMDGETLYRLCEQKVGLAICPAFPDVTHPKLRSIPFNEKYQWKIYGTWKKTAEQDKTLRTFKEYCQRIFCTVK